MESRSPFGPESEARRRDALASQADAQQEKQLKFQRIRDDVVVQLPGLVTSAIAQATTNYENGLSPSGQESFNFGSGDGKGDRWIESEVYAALETLKSDYPDWNIRLSKHDFEGHDGIRGGYLVQAWMSIA